MLRNLRTTILMLCLAVAGAAFAQKPGPGPAPGGDNKIRAKVQERVRALRVARLIERLDLDEAGVAKLMPILDRAYDEIGALAKDAGDARRELMALVAADKPDEARINKLVDKLIAAKQKMDKIGDDMIRDMRKVLTPVQAGKLVVALPEINRQIQQQIRRAAGMGPGGGRGMGRGGDERGDD